MGFNWGKHETVEVKFKIGTERSWSFSAAFGREENSPAFHLSAANCVQLFPLPVIRLYSIVGSTFNLAKSLNITVRTMVRAITWISPTGVDPTLNWNVFCLHNTPMVSFFIISNRPIKKMMQVF